MKRTIINEKFLFFLKLPLIGVSWLIKYQLKILGVFNSFKNCFLGSGKETYSKPDVPRRFRISILWRLVIWKGNIKLNLEKRGFLFRFKPSTQFNSNLTRVIRSLLHVMNIYKSCINEVFVQLILNTKRFESIGFRRRGKGKIMSIVYKQFDLLPILILKYRINFRTYGIYGVKKFFLKLRPWKLSLKFWTPKKQNPLKFFKNKQKYSEIPKYNLKTFVPVITHGVSFWSIFL